MATQPIERYFVVLNGPALATSPRANVDGKAVAQLAMGRCYHLFEPEIQLGGGEGQPCADVWVSGLSAFCFIDVADELPGNSSSAQDWRKDMPSSSPPRWGHGHR